MALGKNSRPDRDLVGNPGLKQISKHTKGPEGQSIKPNNNYFFMFIFKMT